MELDNPWRICLSADDFLGDVHWLGLGLLLPLDEFESVLRYTILGLHLLHFWDFFSCFGIVLLVWHSLQCLLNQCLLHIWSLQEILYWLTFVNHQVVGLRFQGSLSEFRHHWMWIKWVVPHLDGLRVKEYVIDHFSFLKLLKKIAMYLNGLADNSLSESLFSLTYLHLVQKLFGIPIKLVAYSQYWLILRDSRNILPLVIVHLWHQTKNLSEMSKRQILPLGECNWLLDLSKWNVASGRLFSALQEIKGRVHETHHINQNAILLRDNQFSLNWKKLLVFFSHAHFDLRLDEDLVLAWLFFLGLEFVKNCLSLSWVDWFLLLLHALSWWFLTRLNFWKRNHGGWSVQRSLLLLVNELSDQISSLSRYISPCHLYFFLTSLHNNLSLINSTLFVFFLEFLCRHRLIRNHFRFVRNLLVCSLLGVARWILLQRFWGLLWWGLELTRTWWYQLTSFVLSDFIF